MFDVWYMLRGFHTDKRIEFVGNKPTDRARRGPVWLFGMTIKGPHMSRSSVENFSAEKDSV
jgi:hypothetical protein